MVPGVGVAVTVEDDALVLFVGGLDQFAHRRLKVHAAVELGLEFGGQRLHRIGHDHVEHRDGKGDALRAAHRAELELVAGEGERAGAVAVPGVARNLRQHARSQAQEPGDLPASALAAGNAVENFGEFAAQKDTDDGGRRFVGSQPVVVAGRGHADAQQVLVLVDGFDDCRAEKQELQVLVWGRAGFEQVVAQIGAHAPVAVLARAVDPREGFFVHQGHQAVFAGGVAQNLHGELLVVGGHVALLVDRGDLELAGRDLVVAGLDRNAQGVELRLGVGHEAQDPVGNRAEVMVFEFLAARGLGPEEGAARHDQIGAAVEIVLVDQEVLLLRAEAAADPAHRRLEEVERRNHRFVERLDRAQERRLEIERLAGPRRESRGNAQGRAVGVAHDERRAARVPGGVAARLEGGPQAARGKAGGVGFGLNQLAAGKLRQRRAVTAGRQKAVVLLGGAAGERLKPVGVVGGSLVHRPGLHGERHRVGDLGIERVAALQRGLEALEHRLR